MKSTTPAPRPGATTATQPIHPRWVAGSDGGGTLYLSEVTDERIEVVKARRRGRWEVVHVGECPTCFGQHTDGDPCGGEYCDGGNGETRNDACECDRCLVLAAQYCPEQL